jgi:hypothetical protein
VFILYHELTLKTILFLKTSQRNPHHFHICPGLKVCVADNGITNIITSIAKSYFYLHFILNGTFSKALAISI